MINKPIKIILSAAALCTALGVFGSIGVWAMDTRYVTHAGLAQVFDDQRVRFLQDKIFEIELIPVNKRTNTQRAWLIRYTQELHQLTSN